MERSKRATRRKTTDFSVYATAWREFIKETISNKPIRLLGLFGLISAGVFLLFPEIDQWVAGQFYLGNHTFVMSDHPIGNFFDRELHVALEWFLAFFVAAYLLSELLRRPLLNLDRARFLFVIISLAVGAGLIVNVILKEHWGRARPHQTVEFGGTKQFTPAFVMTDQCSRNCSFVSGDAALGFGFVAFALVMRRNRRAWIAAALLFGSTIGLMRMMRGAHFLSDVVFAGIFTILTILIVKRLVLDGLWRHVPRWPRSRHA
jgi:lipid A 4'-phosphatase